MVTIERTPDELLSAQARYQDDLATAEERYAASLRALGRTQDAEWADERARSHRARSAQLRGVTR